MEIIPKLKEPLHPFSALSNQVIPFMFYSLFHSNCINEFLQKMPDIKKTLSVQLQHPCSFFKIDYVGPSELLKG